MIFYTQDKIYSFFHTKKNIRWSYILIFTILLSNSILCFLGMGVFKEIALASNFTSEFQSKVIGIIGCFVSFFLVFFYYYNQMSVIDIKKKKIRVRRNFQREEISFTQIKYLMESRDDYRISYRKQNSRSQVLVKLFTLKINGNITIAEFLNALNLTKNSSKIANVLKVQLIKNENEWIY